MIKKMILVVLTCSLMIFGGGCGSSKTTLNVANWGDYIDEQTVADFEKEYNIKVVYETYDRNEDLYIKLSKGGAEYDVCVPSDYMIEKMIKEDMLAKIDYDNVPNFKNVMDRFKDLPFDSQNQYSIPYLWGTVGIVYNKNEIKEPVDSWSILWNEAYSKKILMMKSQRDSFMVAQKKLGMSMNTTDPSEMEKAKQELIKQRPLVLAYVEDNVKDMMINEEAAITVAWSGEAIYMMEKNENLSYAVPKEGTNMWFDNFVIPKNAPHKKEAELFIDYMCKPEVALKNAEYIGYSTPNQGAFDLLDEETQTNSVVYPDKDILEQCEVYKDLGPEYSEMLDKMWTEITVN